MDTAPTTAESYGSRAADALGIGSGDGDAEATSPRIEELRAERALSGGPGAEHDRLGFFVGTWEVDVETYLDGHAEQPVRTRVTAITRWIAGGRFIETDVRGLDGLLLPMHGRGMMGFDRRIGRYVTVWVDTGATGVTFTEGDFDSGQQQYVLWKDGEESSRIRYIKRATGPDSHVFDVHVMLAAEQPALLQRMRYRRRPPELADA
jgi:hypothetical protein